MADQMFNVSAAQLASLGVPPDQISSLTPSTPAPAPGSGGLFGIGGAGAGFNTSLGLNVGTGQLALGGLSTLGNLWTAWNATQLAQKSFDFNKKLSSDNYTNQADAYNTNLGNIGRSRAVAENQSAATAQAYQDNNKLKTTV